jgi:hypothetical protein
MKDWYGPPIAVGNVPGKVFIHAGGDFRGKIQCGEHASAVDYFTGIARRAGRAINRAGRLQRSTLHMAGFSSLSDLISEATSGGKRRDFFFQKTGSTGVINAASSLWGNGATPAAGANASNAPGGDIPTSATTGSLAFTNPAGGDTQHFVSGYVSASVVSNTLLLYDRLFQVNKTMNSTATEAVTGVPTRYQSTNSSDPDYIGGNFLFPEVGGTALAATAHNWDICTYQNQTDASANLPSVAGIASAITRRLDLPLGNWFAPLASGDVGIKALTQMQCSAAVATGVINFVIGHPLAFMPCPVANMICVADGINSAFNLVRIFDNAALAFLELPKPAATATTYSGSFITVAG